VANTIAHAPAAAETTAFVPGRSKRRAGPTTAASAARPATLSSSSWTLKISPSARPPSVWARIKAHFHLFHPQDPGQVPPQAPAPPRSSRITAIGPRQVAGKGPGLSHWSREQLAKHPEQLEYLAKRGIRPAAVEAHGLGYNPATKTARSLPAARGLGLPPPKRRTSGSRGGLVIPTTRPARSAGCASAAGGEPRYYIIPAPRCRPCPWRGQARGPGGRIRAGRHPPPRPGGDLIRAVALGSARTKPDARSAALLSRPP